MNILHKVQLVTVMTILAGVSILLYIDQDYAIGSGSPNMGTMSTSNHKPSILEGS